MKVAFSPVVLVAVVSCGHPGPAEQPIRIVAQEGLPTEALQFMPLEDGTVYAYDSSSDSGEHGVLMMQISRPRAGRADLKIGSRVERLQVDADGISYVEGGFLLKPPLSRGAEWKSRSGSVRITETDLPVRVPAGDFQGCLRTVEEIRDTHRSKIVTSTYCPHVGLVTMEVVGDTDRGRGHETATLRSFGPRVELMRERDTTTTTTTKTVGE